MAQRIRIHDPVEFRTTEGTQSGFVSSISRQKANVVTPPGTEYSVPFRQLRLQEGKLPKRVFPRSLIDRCAFSVNDKVIFQNGNARMKGHITQMNPNRARVKTAANEIWNVPYNMLNGDMTSKRRKSNLKKLVSTAEEADKLIAKHNLHEWRFNFDNARKRAGCCLYKEQVITMSQQFCLNAEDNEITDTILHEIAHALVGHQHGHNAIWQAKAREIGCSANRTHDVEVSTPRYIVSCRNCGIFGTRDKRGQNRVCKRCHTPVSYENYSTELWNSYQT